METFFWHMAVKVAAKPNPLITIKDLCNDFPRASLTIACISGSKTCTLLIDVRIKRISFKEIAHTKSVMLLRLYLPDMIYLLRLWTVNTVD